MIKWCKILLFGAFIAISFSCSRSILGKSKNVYTVSDNNDQEQNVDQRVVIKPSKTDDKNDKSWLEIVEKVDSSNEIAEFDNSTVYKDIETDDFSTREIQHASISNYNPFDKNGEMYFNLRSMSREFHYPANGHLLSDYGRRGRGSHSGVDIKAEKGDNIYAAFDGVVRMSSYYGGYGNMVIIRHYNGLETIYGHNTKNLVKVGDKVSSGDVIAYAGKTGRASGFHVHFEVRVKGQIINPNLLINTTSKKLQDKDLYIYNRSGKVYASNNSTKKKNIEKEPIKEVEVKEVAEKPKVVESKSEKTVAATTEVHTIKSGDTLYKLSKTYGTTIAELCRLNNITEKATLRLGQKIKLK